ncbi:MULTISPECIES: hypothetical protein [unclassified Aureimonas]|uniref:hypothetical protein n=1 Tax=unclassified Aureimonas TaxID=2615206 RepID=UPI0006F6AF56|nr:MULTISPECIES: hypothetical protein [unclassified Aureimonas]KQT52334.1 hypothetical protein ASG62_16630 [Aureimonas sp. Leaf427]KQT61838.1 hypothetical protein ASG54_23715 [Aureimonas sp. Leaf460]
MPNAESHSDHQSAVRLLACICAAAAPVKGAEFGPDVVGILHAQTRLQALDFWVRYPDYLANELINEFALTSDRADLDLARRILDDREPDLRRVPMIRFHFGAYEPVHNAISILRSRELVRQQKVGDPNHLRETAYLLTSRGRDAMQRLADLAPELAWYRDRAAVAARVAGGAGASALKDRQYLQKEYAATPLRGTIPPIEDHVRERLRKIDEGDAG